MFLQEGAISKLILKGRKFSERLINPPSDRAKARRKAMVIGQQMPFRDDAYITKLAKNLELKAQYDRTLKGRATNFANRVDKFLQGGKHESIEENAPVIGRHNPLKIRPRLKGPTGGDSAFRHLPPGDRKPNNGPKQIGRLVRKPNNLSPHESLISRATNFLLEAPQVNLAPKPAQSLLVPRDVPARKTNFSSLAKPANLAGELDKLPKNVLTSMLSTGIKRSQKNLNKDVERLSTHIPSRSTLAGTGLEAMVVTNKLGQNPEKWTVTRVSTPKRPVGIKPRPKSNYVTPSLEAKRVGRFQLDVAPYRLAGEYRSPQRGLASVGILYNMHKEGLFPSDAHSANIGVHPITRKTELIDPGFVTQLKLHQKKNLHDFYMRTDPTSMSSDDFRTRALMAVNAGKSKISQIAQAAKNAPAPIYNSLNVKRPKMHLAQVKDQVHGQQDASWFKHLHYQIPEVKGLAKTTDVAKAIVAANNRSEAVSRAVDRILESALANAAGGGNRANAAAADGTTNGVNMSSSTPVIGNSTVKTYAAGKASGGGKLGGGFGTQGQGASRFSGNSRAGTPTRTQGSTGVGNITNAGATSWNKGGLRGGVGTPQQATPTTARHVGGPPIGTPTSGGAGTTGNVTGTKPQPAAAGSAPKPQAQAPAGNVTGTTPQGAKGPPPVGGGDKVQHNSRDLNPGNITQAQRETGANIMNNQASRMGNRSMSNSGARFAGGGPRPMGGGGYRGGGGSSYGNSYSGYNRQTNFSIGGGASFGGGRSRGRIGASFGSSTSTFGGRSSGYGY